MQRLSIEKTNKTPEITFDKETNTFRIEGHCRPENADTFYAPINNWLDKYSEDPNQHTTIEVKLDYISVASSKVFGRILAKLKKVKELGKEVKVSWYHREEDWDIAEVGEDFAGVLDIPIEVVRLN